MREHLITSRFYHGIRTSDGSTYVEYEGAFREIYKLNTDPYELQNLYATADPALVARKANDHGERHKQDFHWGEDETNRSETFVRVYARWKHTSSHYQEGRCRASRTI